MSKKNKIIGRLEVEVTRLRGRLAKVANRPGMRTSWRASVSQSRAGTSRHCSSDLLASLPSAKATPAPCLRHQLVTRGRVAAPAEVAAAGEKEAAPVKDAVVSVKEALWRKPGKSSPAKKTRLARSPQVRPLRPKPLQPKLRCSTSCLLQARPGAPARRSATTSKPVRARSPRVKPSKGHRRGKADASKGHQRSRPTRARDPCGQGPRRRLRADSCRAGRPLAKVGGTKAAAGKANLLPLHRKHLVHKDSSNKSATQEHRQ